MALASEIHSNVVPKIRRIKLTDAVRYRIALVRRAYELDCPHAAYDYTAIDQAKRELADELIALVEAQESVERAARLRRLPNRAVAAVVELSLRPKRGRRRA